MSILALASAKPLESNDDMVLVRVDGLSHTVIYPLKWIKETGQICLHGLAAIYYTTSTRTRECQLMIPCGIQYHIMSQLGRRGMGIFQCYLLLVINCRQGRVFLIDATGNAKLDKRTGTNQIQHKEHKNICLSYVVTKVIILQNAANRKCYMSSRNMKEAYQNLHGLHVVKDLQMELLL